MTGKEGVVIGRTGHVINEDTFITGEKGCVIGTGENTEVVTGEGDVVIGGTGHVINEDEVITDVEEEEGQQEEGCCSRKKLRR